MLQFHHLLACLLLGMAYILPAQHPVVDSLLGYWEGSFIVNNSAQDVKVRFFKVGDQLYALQEMEEWMPSFGEFELMVKVDSTGLVQMPTGYGPSVLRLDGRRMELSGYVKNQHPALYFHLKRVPAPPAPIYTTRPLDLKGKDDNVLKGVLHTQIDSDARNLIIFVGGRGCGVDETQYNLYARVLRKYGIDVYTY